MRDFLFELYCWYMDWYERRDWGTVLFVTAVLLAVVYFVLLGVESL